MLTYEEVVELRKNLINESIELNTAKNLYWKDYKEGKRSWHTKDWGGNKYVRIRMKK